VYSETDKHDVTLYHRLNDISFQEVTNQSFGSHKKYQEVDDLSLIVFGKRAAIDQFTMERIARKAIASIDARTVVRSDFNALQVFANEYLGVTYFLTPEYYMFKINYRITSTYDDRCATIV
jgi:predicted kinase